MTIRPELSLNPAQANLTTVLPLFQQAREAKQRRDMMPLEMDLAKQKVAAGEIRSQEDVMRLDEARRSELIGSMIQGASEVKPFTDQNDIPGAISQLQARREMLMNKGLDTYQTDQALELARTDPVQFKNSVNALVQSGIQSGVISGGMPQVQSSKILEDGTTVQLLKSGETRVTNPEGMAVTGDERVEALRKAQEAGIALQESRSGARKRGSLTAELENIPQRERVEFLSSNREAFNIDILESNSVLDDIDRAIAIWENAPGTISGPLAGRAPALSDQAQELESILTQLGIDRLSAFKGATSEKELAAAFRAGASIDQDSVPGIRRLKKQRRAIENNLNRIKGLRSEADGLLAKEPTQAKDFDLEYDPATGTFK